MTAVPALAQDQSGDMPAGGQGQGQEMQGGDQQQMRHKMFEERKADILARLQKVESCIQAADDQQALVACLPHRQEGQKGQMRGGLRQGGVMQGTHGPGMMQQEQQDNGGQ